MQFGSVRRPATTSRFAELECASFGLREPAPFVDPVLWIRQRHAVRRDFLPHRLQQRQSQRAPRQTFEYRATVKVNGRGHEIHLEIKA